jgi:hypothetical protein
MRIHPPPYSIRFLHLEHRGAPSCTALLLSRESEIARPPRPPPRQIVFCSKSTAPRPEPMARCNPRIGSDRRVLQSSHPELAGPRHAGRRSGIFSDRPERLLFLFKRNTAGRPIAVVELARSRRPRVYRAGRDRGDRLPARHAKVCVTRNRAHVHQQGRGY